MIFNEHQYQNSVAYSLLFLLTKRFNPHVFLNTNDKGQEHLLFSKVAFYELTGGCPLTLQIGAKKV